MTTRTAAALLTLFFCAGGAFAEDGPPSDASIRELLSITDARNLVEGVKGQMHGLMDAAMKQALQGKEPTPDVQAVLERMKTKMLTAMNESMQWETFEPLYLRIYKASFTQSELDGMIALYKTPAGQTLIKKLPVVMRNLMGEMPAMMRPSVEKIRAIQQETFEELRALEEKKAGQKKPG
jgi:uncharacterized protein